MITFQFNQRDDELKLRLEGLLILLPPGQPASLQLWPVSCSWLQLLTRLMSVASSVNDLWAESLLCNQLPIKTKVVGTAMTPMTPMTQSGCRGGRQKTDNRQQGVDWIIGRQLGILRISLSKWTSRLMELFVVPDRLLLFNYRVSMTSLRFFELLR